RYGRMIGASGSAIALHPNISTALTSVAETLDYKQRRRVVITRLDFPTVAYQWLARVGKESSSSCWTRRTAYRFHWKRSSEQWTTVRRWWQPVTCSSLPAQSRMSEPWPTSPTDAGPSS